jgi:hypothetical protein
MRLDGIAAFFHEIGGRRLVRGLVHYILVDLLFIIAISPVIPAKAGIQ